MLPQHEKCHCTTKNIVAPIAGISAIADCPMEKIKNYAFVDKAKKKFFNDNGYDIIDSGYIKNEYERQAQEKYVRGDYLLGNLDQYGQRITIVMELPSRTNNNKIFIPSGWLVNPKGHIRNTTPATSLSLDKVGEISSELGVKI